MIKYTEDLFEKLRSNKKNFIAYYEGNRRFVKTFSDFMSDVDLYTARLDAINPGNKKIGLLGPTSYHWMVLEYACIKGGYHSIAFPETVGTDKLAKLVLETEPGLMLVDQRLKSSIGNLCKTYYFNGSKDDKESIESIDAEHDKAPPRIAEGYSTAFSSGTSENIKKINMLFKPRPPEQNDLATKLKSLRDLALYHLSFWSGKNNKIIIFMPFSHLQQRTFVRMALTRKINILLSSPSECIRHLILDKPNIMISVPVIYEALARRIDEKLRALSPARKRLHSLYLGLGINNLSDMNPIKKAANSYLFKDIRKIYGGRADYFVTGSAPIDIKVLHTFHNIGVRIYEGYGQSESTFISMNSPLAYRLGSVGKPQIEVKIAENSEILVKYIDRLFEHNMESLRVENGFLHTGDLGYLDKKGFLFLKGRIDDVIVLANGKKVFPNTVEMLLKRNTLISHAMVFEGRNSKLCAIVYSDRIKAGTQTAISDVGRVIAETNRQLADYECISHFILIDEPFSIENQMLTSTFKVRRKNVVNKYAANPLNAVS